MPLSDATSAVDGSGIAGCEAEWSVGDEAMNRYRVYWFFRRKVRIVLLTVLTYAALC